MTKSLEATMYIEELKSKIKLLENLRYPYNEGDEKGLSEEILKSAENLKNLFDVKENETEEVEIPTYTILGITYSKEEIVLHDGEKVFSINCSELKKYL